MRQSSKASSRAIALVMIIVCALPAAADQPFSGLFRGLRRLGRGVTEKAIEQQAPNRCEHQDVEELADQIDWLEHHLEIYGSVVPKHPDVWGEARLTRHRQDVELELRKQLSSFRPTLQASLRRTDQAALAMAIALGNAELSGDKSITNVFGVANAPADGSVVNRNDPAQPTATQFSNYDGEALSISLEPVVHNDQMFRYLNALNELRRINEGDDTADAPGYSMNLMRVPVSLLPGKRTREGYGAEVGFTLRPVLGDDLLPQTFRQLAINDQVDQLALPMVRTLERYPDKPLDEDPLLDLKAIVRGQRLAAPTIAAMEQRLDVLQGELFRTEQQRAYFDFVDDYREYFRQRINEIFTVTVINDQRPATPDPTIVALSEDTYQVGGQHIHIAAKLDLDTTTPQLEDLFKYRVAVVPMQIQMFDVVGGVKTQKPFVDVTIQVVVYEQSIDDPIQPGDLPYRLAWPLGKVEVFANTSTIDPQLVSVLKALADQGLIEAQKLVVEQISGAGQENLRALQPIATGASFIARFSTASSPGIPQTLMSFIGPRSRMPILVDFELLDLLYQRFSSLPKSRNASQSTQTNMSGIAQQLSNSVVNSYLGQTSSQNSKEQWNAEIDKSNGQVTAGKNDSNYQPDLQTSYRGEVSDSVDRFALKRPLFRATMPGPAAPQRGRRSIQPIPPSQFAEVYGAENLLVIASTIDNTLRSSHPNTGRERLLIDVRRVLHDELSAAYDFLSREHTQMWRFACEGLAEAIRSNDMVGVRCFREQYMDTLPRGLRTDPIGALGWCLMVESSLLNARLIEDMNTLASEKGCLCGDVTGMCFWGPTPPPESCQAFNSYVQCRWPIQVFALDPVSNEQNVADSFSSRRELQLAAAIGVANGELSPQAAGQFVRRLEIDLQTIGINRTQVAYGHGDDSFGWRFYPRIQTPGTPSTIGAFAESLLGGPGRDALVRSRQMEPGIRECTAVVLMPSFVPYLTLSSRGNWFHLTNPADKELTMNDTMKLSSAHQAIQKFASCTKDCGCYRPGDVAQMHDVIDRLDKRLPLQSTTVQIPHENALGGFEMFHTGNSDLSPDLIGWYGAPGIDPTGVTTLFLVGKGFSVHETRVIVGGRAAEYRLLSREIMEVVIPPNTQTLGQPTSNPDSVDVHIATPYGVSSHLLIPQIRRPDPSATTAISFDPEFVAGEATITVPSTGDPTIAMDDTLLSLGVRVPTSVRSATGKLKLTALTASATTPPTVSSAVELDVTFDASSNRMLSAAGFGTLKAQLDALVLAFAKANVTARPPRMMILVSGNLTAGATSHPITTALPIDIGLTWK
ncbi:hypothetical protein LOC67_16055 [Stieleria sp. JC731]|nr:hypothetical protein [Stieleria sp. JC731]MCC9602077.1 hypothetical protein [Stieleria sp. JC731]